MTRNDAKPEKKGGAGLWLALGGGCAVLLLCVACGLGGAGIWWLNHSPEKRDFVENKDIKDQKPPEKPVDQDKGKPPADLDMDKGKPPADKGGDGGKLKNPLIKTGPVAKVADAELGPPQEVWEFSIRIPKNLVQRFKDKKDGGPGNASYYEWVTPDITDEDPGASCNVLRQKLNVPLDAFTALTANQKFKSKPGAPLSFDTIVMPELVEIDGLPGARWWRLYDLKNRHTVSIEYRIHSGEWSYFIRAGAVGKTEAEARRLAEIVDAAICTFRKR